jgi:SAUR family protein
MQLRERFVSSNELVLNFSSILGRIKKKEIMSTCRKSRDIDKKKALVMLRLLIQKLQRGLSVLVPRGPEDLRAVQVLAATMVPDDVSEGQFAVFAVKGEETKRFVVELAYLTNPAFLRLLEKAKEEYGFRQKGALEIPCLPEELQKILDDRSY